MSYSVCLTGFSQANASRGFQKGLLGPQYSEFEELNAPADFDFGDDFAVTVDDVYRVEKRIAY